MFDVMKGNVRNKPVENHQIWFDSQTHRGMNFDDWQNVNRRFWLRVLRIVRHSKLPMFRPCCGGKRKEMRILDVYIVLKPCQHFHSNQIQSINT